MNFIKEHVSTQYNDLEGNIAIDLVDGVMGLYTLCENHNIDIIKKVQDVKLNQLDGELMQVLINVLNNAKDILKENEIDNKVIEIQVLQKKMLL